GVRVEPEDEAIDDAVLLVNESLAELRRSGLRPRQRRARRDAGGQARRRDRQPVDVFLRATCELILARRVGARMLTVKDEAVMGMAAVVASDSGALARDLADAGSERCGEIEALQHEPQLRRRSSGWKAGAEERRGGDAHRTRVGHVHLPFVLAQ